MPSTSEVIVTLWWKADAILLLKMIDYNQLNTKHS